MLRTTQEITASAQAVYDAAPLAHGVTPSEETNKALDVAKRHIADLFGTELHFTESESRSRAVDGKVQRSVSFQEHVRPALQSAGTLPPSVVAVVSNQYRVVAERMNPIARLDMLPPPPVIRVVQRRSLGDEIVAMMEERERAKREAEPQQPAVVQQDASAVEVVKAAPKAKEPAKAPAAKPKAAPKPKPKVQPMPDDGYLSEVPPDDAYSYEAEADEAYF